MGTLALVEVGRVPAGPLRALPALIGLATGLDVRWVPGRVDASPALDLRRGQLDSRRVLAALEAERASGDGWVVGLANEDLYSTVFTFVFGEAQLEGRYAVVSLHRLRSELYGLPADPFRLQQRLAKETLHEVGHLFGLKHCRAPGCVMGFSGTVEEIDDKGTDYCDRCLEVVVARRDAPPQGA